MSRSKGPITLCMLSLRYSKDRPNDVSTAHCLCATQRTDQMTSSLHTVFCATPRADKVTSSLSVRCLCATPRADEVTSALFVCSLRSPPGDPHREDPASADPPGLSEARDISPKASELLDFRCLILVSPRVVIFVMSTDPGSSTVTTEGAWWLVGRLSVTALVIAALSVTALVTAEWLAGDLLLAHDIIRSVVMTTWRPFVSGVTVPGDVSVPRRCCKERRHRPRRPAGDLEPTDWLAVLSAGMTSGSDWSVPNWASVALFIRPPSPWDVVLCASAVSPGYIRSAGSGSPVTVIGGVRVTIAAGTFATHCALGSRLFPLPGAVDFRSGTHKLKKGW